MEQASVRVLIAEDDFLVGAMIKGLVREIGYTVVGEATNGCEAVSMTESLRPDIILMDVEMPDLDGIEAARRISERFPTPIIILTAYEAPDLFRQAQAVGVMNYLVKPSNVRELERAIKLALAQFDHVERLNRYVEELDARSATGDAEDLRAKILETVSHELSTPITTIKAYVELMQRYPERTQAYLNTLRDEAEHQAELMECILQLYRIRERKQRVHITPVPLGELVGSVILNFHDVAQQRGVALSHQTGESDPVALADAEQLQYAVGHLVENALLYTPQGGKVAVSTRQASADGEMWGVVAVRDTGIGISEEELPHLFKGFFRGRDVREQQISGLGLGLAIVKEIMECQGGRVAVESQIGEGSTFTLWLPLAD
jgi:signal transduction histidine kinase